MICPRIFSLEFTSKNLELKQIKKLSTPKERFICFLKICCNHASQCVESECQVRTPSVAYIQSLTMPTYLGHDLCHTSNFLSILFPFKGSDRGEWRRQMPHSLRRPSGLFLWMGHPCQYVYPVGIQQNTS